jgi:hypothetical protein
MGKSRILGISMGFVGIWDGFKGKSEGISLVRILDAILNTEVGLNKAEYSNK